MWKPWKDWKRIFEKKITFPCAPESNCIVLPACTKPCDKLIMDDEKLLEFFNKYKCCPDCGGAKFYEGSSGGLCTNVKCSTCGHWFNIGYPLVFQRIHIFRGRFVDK